MSRDFELLRKAELQANKRAARREIYPEFGRIDELPGISPPSFQAAPPRERESEWIHALSILRKRWRLVAGFAAVVVAVVALIVFSIKPEYEPSARLEIDPPGTEAFSMQAAGASPGETQYLETEAQNLQSDDLAIAVIRKLRLDNEPGFAGKVTADNPDANSSLLTPAENVALRTLRARLKVVHDPNTHIITVSVVANNPRLAADVTNTLAQTFVDRTLQMRRDAIANSRAWLRNQLQDVRAKVEQSNRDLAAFQKKTGVADVDEGRNTFGDLMTELDRQTTQIQTERIQLESYIQKAKAGEVEALPQVRDNPVVQKLTQNLAEVRAQLSQDLVIYGVNHPNTRKLKSQEAELERQLALQRKEALDQLRISYDAARARERLMAVGKKEAAKTIGDMAEYNILKKQAQAQSSLYNSLLSRIEEAGIAAASQSSNIRVVDSARVLDQPTRPHRIYDLGLGLFAGIVGGVLLAFIREKLDNPLRTAHDIRAWTGIPSVQIIPEFSGSRFPLIGGNGIRGLLAGRSGENQFKAGPAKFLLERPHSPEAEAVRALHANIMLANVPPQAVLVTSSLPGEGKTTVAVNLALALSKHGKTCLVDADLRRPCIAATCGVLSDKGLGDVLLEPVVLEDALVSMENAPNLVVLPGGEPSNDRAHLIATASMKLVLDSLRERFDFIIIDSSPIIAYAEGRILSSLTDGIIFVARSGVTPGPAMVRSMELLQDVQSPPIIKVVLNAHDSLKHDLYYYPSKQP
jgi:polysaccharide biosynthesis transport protein